MNYAWQDGISTMESLSGKCYCGAVQYRVADEFLYAANCHCSNCRRTTGSAFKPFGGIERGKLEVTDGADKLLIVGEEDLHDAHCAECGSMLFSVVRSGEYVHVAYGTLSKLSMQWFGTDYTVAPA